MSIVKMKECKLSNSSRTNPMKTLVFILFSIISVTFGFSQSQPKLDNYPHKNIVNLNTFKHRSVNVFIFLILKRSIIIISNNLKSL